MMSEKRFVQSWNMHRGFHYLAIEDTQEKKMYCVEQSREDVEKVADLLNEQQTTISALKEENERKTNEIKLLRKAYSKIPKGIREVWKE